MKDEYHPEIIPRHESGFSLEAEKPVTLSTDEEAKSFFQIAKQRLLHVNKWKNIAGILSAEFQLTDSSGAAVEGEVKEGFYFQIDIPGPGPAGGEGYDWVQVEKISEQTGTDKESIVIRVRPASNPIENKNHVDHFYSEESTSNFTIVRDGKTITATIYDRNIKPNVEGEEKQDKVR
jgi:hypothetical protein